MTTYRNSNRFQSTSESIRAIFKNMGFVSLVAGFLFLAIPGYARAVGDMIHCQAHDNMEDYNEFKEILSRDPGSTPIMFTLGIKALCFDRIQEGMAYMQRASDMGHVDATDTIAIYYSSDGTFDSANGITKDQKNYDATIYYYEKAADLIESANNYPKGVSDDQDSLENENHTSANVFTQLPFVYYMGYVHAMIEILNSSEKLLYEDSIEVLEKMRHSADRCLRRPALSEWQSEKERIYRAMQVQCQARKDFAAQSIPLEKKRMRVARNCSGPLGDCPEHKEITDQIIHLSDIMGAKIRSTPL